MRQFVMIGISSRRIRRKTRQERVGRSGGCGRGGGGKVEEGADGEGRAGKFPDLDPVLVEGDGDEPLAVPGETSGDDRRSEGLQDVHLRPRLEVVDHNRALRRPNRQLL